MYFRELAEYFYKLEQTDSRNQMTEILADLFRNCKPDEIDKVCYLSLGKLVPQYESYEFNIAEKLIFEVLARAYATEKQDVQRQFGLRGDLGLVAETYAEAVGGSRLKENLSINDVFQKFWEIAGAGGEGSVEKKITLMADLLQSLDPRSAKYIVRIPLKKMRLGFSDMTILDALSYMTAGNKTLRSKIEPYYNISADIGKIARVFKESGIEGLEKIVVEPGIPILTAAAERLPNAQAIVDKIGGEFVVEPKFDGFRMQIHKRGDEIRIFSRNLENTTDMFPDICLAAQKIVADTIIFEGEAIGYNPDTQEFLPFQETVQRKRKYDIYEMAKKIPLKLFVFDLLYINGEIVMYRPQQERRKLLEEVFFHKGETFELAQEKIITEAKELERYFQETITQGLEGVMVKKPDAPYKAGARDFSWIKYKREEHGQLQDTIDCLIMGYYFGQGKRTGFGIGALLVGVYDKETDTFPTIAKIGTGLTDDQWREIKRQCDEITAKSKPARYTVCKELVPDSWVLPELVTVVRADEITRSPLHSAGRSDKEPGYALRFPRVMELLRTDKNPEEVTTVSEIKGMDLNQQKANSG